MTTFSRALVSALADLNEFDTACYATLMKIGPMNDRVAKGMPKQFEAFEARLAKLVSQERQLSDDDFNALECEAHAEIQERQRKRKALIAERARRQAERLAEQAYFASLGLAA